MMLYATLVMRALHPRRVNLDRVPEALSKRVSISDFFGRFPQLHAILLAELERGLNDSLDDLPVRSTCVDIHPACTERCSSQSSNLDSPLFAILMLFGLLQTRESSEATSGLQSGAYLSAPFVPLVKACARSRVWKVKHLKPVSWRVAMAADIHASRSEVLRVMPLPASLLRAKWEGRVSISSTVSGGILLR